MIAILSISLALLAGLMMTRLMHKINLPDVTAYLIAGVLIGPFVLGRLGIHGIGFTSYEDAQALDVISEIALGFIAFAIGNEFRLAQLKKIGKQAAVIGIIQAIVAALLVDAALIALHFIMPETLSLASAITLGAIATATAPAATLMVVRQYKAKGEVTQILLPVVALDDAVGLAVFAVSFGVAKALVSGTIDLVSVVLQPLAEIVLSLLMGAVLGLVLTQLEKLFHSNRNRISLIISFVFMTVALAMLEFDIGGFHISFSSLLVCMMLGTIFCNGSQATEDLMDKSDRWTAPVLTLFFVISGAELDLSVFSSLAVVLIGIVYILSRSAGKYLGAYSSAALMKCSPNVRKYLGITLLPQAGVALGMCMKASELGTTEGVLVRNIILFSVLIYELVGPSLTKLALERAGDILPKDAGNMQRTPLSGFASTVKRMFR